MKQELICREDVMNALMRGFVIELHYQKWKRCTPYSTRQGFLIEYTWLPVEIVICHRLRDIPTPGDIFEAIEGYDPDGVWARAYAIPKLRSHR